MKKQKGRTYYLKARKRWFVDWYHVGKSHKIYRNLDGSYLLTKQDAESLLNVMRLEDQTGTFTINKYTKSFVDTESYVQKWLQSTKDTLSPSTQRIYQGHLKNYIVPYFEQNPCKLQDVQLDILYDFLNTLKGKSGSTKLSIFSAAGQGRIF